MLQTSCPCFDEPPSPSLNFFKMEMNLEPSVFHLLSYYGERFGAQRSERIDALPSPHQLPHQLDVMPIMRVKWGGGRIMAGEPKLGYVWVGWKSKEPERFFVIHCKCVRVDFYLNINLKDGSFFYLVSCSAKGGLRVHNISCPGHHRQHYPVIAGTRTTYLLKEQFVSSPAMGIRTHFTSQ